MQKYPTAFISYSWDSDEHQHWVLNLMNKLRSEGGVDATMDIIQTQTGTINLNTMMVKALKDYDYVIMVLTEKYAQKADELSGGVGFETELSLPVLRNNPNKIILIARNDFGKALPFHLQSYHALDFRNQSDFETSFRGLLHRIHGVPRYEVAPLGKIPDLQPYKTTSAPKNISLMDELGIETPKLKKFTDLDKSKFMRQSFREKYY